MTTYTLRKGNPATTRTDVVVIGVRTTDKGGLAPVAGGDAVADAFGRKFEPLLRSLDFRGKVGQVVRFPSGGTVKAGSVVVVGFGDAAETTARDVRRAAAAAARNVGNAASVALALPADSPELVAATTDGFRSGSYRYLGMRKDSAPEAALSDVVVLCDQARKKEFSAALDRAGILGAAIDRTRDWTNEPPNLLTPETFAGRARDLLKDTGVTVTVTEPDELAELGCGGILAVGMGSTNTPRLVRMHWKPKKAAKGLPRVALVGKGITYDSGGLTIKPGGSMTSMKCDMAGAAAVVNAMSVIAQLNLPVEVTAYAPMAENAISGGSYRPGDIVTMYGGRTVEVTNTDAEGRMILADALAMAAETAPDAILEISTLTGACVVALGDRVAGLFATGEGASAAAQAAADAAGEMLWHLPVTEHTREQVRTESHVADVLQHNWVRWGSSSWAAAFLMEFTGDVPFAHLDIAGPGWNSGGPWEHEPKGATGYGVATLVQWVSDKAAGA